MMDLRCVSVCTFILVVLGPDSGVRVVGGPHSSMRTHTTTYVSSYYSLCPHTWGHTLCPHTWGHVRILLHVSSYYSLSVLIPGVRVISAHIGGDLTYLKILHPALHYKKKKHRLSIRQHASAYDPEKAYVSMRQRTTQHC